MIRMLALDLDETTLRSDGTISLYTMQTLQRAAAQGVILVAASGRPLRSLPEHLQACGVRYAVVSNGAAVYELEGEQLLRQLFLPADAVTALFQLVQEEQDRQVLVEAGLHGQMYAPADYVADPISFRYNAAVAAYVRRTRKPVEDMARFLQMHVQEIDCMDIICPNGTRKAQMAQKVSNAGLPVYMTSSVPQLVEIAPVYYVPGNHEWPKIVFEGSTLASDLEALGVHFLADKYETVTIGSNTLLIGGIAEAPVSYEKYASGFLEDFAAQPGYKMLLVHYPEYYAEDTGALIGKDIDMALCGHAHGGQVRLPFLGALYTPDQGFLPDLTEGVQTISGTKVIISRGLGDDVGQILPRINNPPELVIIDANWY